MALNQTSSISALGFIANEVEKRSFIDEFKTIYLNFCFPIIFAIGGVWNLLIIVYFIKINIKNLKMMSSYHFLIINLAVTDFIAVVGISFLIPNLYQPTWQLGLLGCKILPSLVLRICPMASCWHLLLISYARYRSIVHSFKKNMSKKQFGLISALIWILSVIMYSYAFTTRKLAEFHGQQKCYSTLDKFLIASFLFGFCFDGIISLSLMFYFSHEIEKKVHEIERSISLPLHQGSRKRNRKALQTIRGLIMVYNIIVLPFRLFDAAIVIYIFVVSRKGTQLVLMLRSFMGIISSITLLTHFNSMLNIFVYLRIIPGFRKFIINIFTLGLLNRRKYVLDR